MNETTNPAQFVTQARGTGRPLGVTLVALASFLIAGLSALATFLFVGIGWVAEGQRRSNSIAIVGIGFGIVGAIFSVAVGIACVGVGIGLWRMRPWVRLVAIALAGTEWPFAALLLLSALSQTNLRAALLFLLFAAIGAGAIWSLSRADVRQLFASSTRT